LEWAVIILINAPARIRTRDLWLWYHIELHAPTSSTQKLKLIEKGGQFTYTPTTPVPPAGASLICLRQVLPAHPWSYTTFVALHHRRRHHGPRGQATLRAVGANAPPKFAKIVIMVKFSPYMHHQLNFMHPQDKCTPLICSSFPTAWTHGTA
jgi:hypothetical protein